MRTPTTGPEAECCPSRRWKTLPWPAVWVSNRTGWSPPLERLRRHRNRGVALGHAFRHRFRLLYSKGLGAPVGSAVAGPADWIKRARHYRKRFGGGMRQAGILAAGALLALRRHRGRLAEDHARARRLAKGIAGVEGLELDPAMVDTNIVVAGLREGGGGSRRLVRGAGRARDPHGSVRSEGPASGRSPGCRR